MRSGKLKDGLPVHLKKGQDFFFVNDCNVIGDNTRASTTYLKELVQVGDIMCADDGAISFIVTERLEGAIKTTVQNNGILGENKGITFPQHTIEELPALSAQDRNDVLFAIEQQVDFVSVSCMRDIEDLEELR